MSAYILRRLFQSLLLILASATLVALFIHLIPGDPVTAIAGQEITPERAEVIRRELGLDRPIYVQYAEWLGGVATGDLGTSLTSSRPIRGDLISRFPRTLELIVVSTLLAVAVGIPAGVIAASYRDRLPDFVVSIVSLVGISVPVFVTGTLLVLVFGVKFNVLPGTGYVIFSEDPIGHVKRLILPAVTLAFLFSAIVVRMTRSSLLEVLNEDYVRTARAKGLSQRVVLFSHALRNALIPVVTVIGLHMGGLLGGSVIVEYIFNWPGVSSYLITAIGQRDYPSVQAVMLVIAVLFILLNLLTDLMYAVIDPRIKYE